MKLPAVDHYQDYSPTWKERINPLWWFGNVKWTPECPDKYRDEEWPNRSMKFATIMWYIRNPIQNFTHYVIGISDKVDEPEFKVIGRDPTKLFSRIYNFNYWVIKYKWIVLPGFSLWFPLKKNKDGDIDEQLNFHLQFGWKKSGNIGAAFRRQIGL